MKVIFISPHFPRHFYQFCKRLKERGVTVLGIGDAPWEAIGEDCQNSLSDYRYVTSLQDYEQVYRTVADYVFRYGHIDYVESENEYWLELDAQLRTDFNITTGPKFEDMAAMNRKSRMKEAYARAGIPTARWTLPQTENALQPRFIPSPSNWSLVANFTRSSPSRSIAECSTSSVRSRTARSSSFSPSMSHMPTGAFGLQHGGAVRIQELSLLLLSIDMCIIPKRRARKGADCRIQVNWTGRIRQLVRHSRVGQCD